MSGGESGLPRLLTAAETAAPIDAVDVVAEDLRRRFQATGVSFLIVDLTGRAVARLSTAGAVEGGREAERIPMFGSVYEQVIRTQRLYQEATDRGQRVIVPVTNRGDAIGLLELLLPAAPGEDTLKAVGEAAHVLAYVVIANGRFTDFYTWGKRSRRPRWQRRSSTSCCPRPCPARQRSSPCAATWSPPRTSAATPSTTRWTGTLCTCR
ncbi:hypothetical protein [Streptomyces sp. NPDC058202]|uniref:hypothetical protein n=1 Tax=Streptomyces sp. NPDC058202 TaxID=3346380 RepID=UPI0036E42758